MDRSTIFDAEHKLLAALCQGTVDAAMRVTILRALQAHAFADPDHEVIYRALARIPAVNSAEIRPMLIQAVTRLGFPDVGFDALFTVPAPTPDYVPALLERLQSPRA